MKNSEYWQERFKQLEEAQNKQAQMAFKEVEAEYRAAQRELEGKINTWYQRIAKNNGISMAEARKPLSASELVNFKWDIHDYIKYGKGNGLSGQWIKQLENVSAKLSISKYDALMIDTRQSFEQMFGSQLRTVTETMGRIYENGYYRTVYELQKGVGIGFDVRKINHEEVEKVLSKPWAADGKNFSERILGNKDKLINEVHNELTQKIITGADPQKAIDAIAKKMNTSKSNAGRLVMTEEAYFSSVAQGKSYNDLGVEQYEVLATLDSVTSEICQNLDGKVFDMKDYQAGVTAPPFHVRCRSTTVPHLDEKVWGVGERVAGGEDGKAYYVPDNITYPKWKEQFVNGGDKSGLVEVDKSGKGGIINEKPILTSEQTIDKAKELAFSEEYKSAHNFKEIRAITNKKLGYDGLPKVVDETEFEKLSNGKTVFYRGVKQNGNKTVTDIINDFKYGELWTGNSGGAVYGNGVYFTATKDIVKQRYADSSEAIIEMVLDDSSKVTDYKTLFDEYFTIGLAKKFKKNEDYQFILADIGQYAAVKGYDAVALNGFQNCDYVILLNRTKAIVKE